jgi:hypothetical protein
LVNLPTISSYSGGLDGPPSHRWPQSSKSHPTKDEDEEDELEGDDDDDGDEEEDEEGEDSDTGGTMMLSESGGGGGDEIESLPLLTWLKLPPPDPGGIGTHFRVS